jgi:putative membrane protein
LPGYSASVAEDRAIRGPPFARVRVARDQTCECVHDLNNVLHALPILKSMSDTDPDPFARFSPEQLILRDQLALDRTVLANERTFLSYVRTALAFGVVGATCLHLGQGPGFRLAGLVFLGLAACTAAIGLWRYRTVRRTIRRMKSVGA